MKRVLVAVLSATLATLVGYAGAHAESTTTKKSTSAKGSKGKGKGKDKAAPASAEIAKSMGDLHWGMSRDEVTKYFLDKAKEKYRPLLAKTKDAVEEDRLRQAAHQEVDAIKKGTVEFDGRTTGWDVSFLKGEFSQGNDESMLVVRDANSQNFYFFMGGKLWKWYKAFDAAVFPVNSFAAFGGAVQKRFGTGKDVQGEIRPGEGQLHWVEWQDKQTRLRAVDETSFYGFYCLVFEEKATGDNLAKLRRNSDQGGDKHHAVIDSVTAERNVTNPDESANIADRITGRMHQNEQKSADDGSQQVSASAKGKGKAAKSESKPTESTGGVDKDNDPISGLGL